MTYEEFVGARLQPLLRYATMLTGDPHLAADLVQDVMVRVQLHWRKVAGADVPELYVRRMLTNAYLDVRRTGWWRLNTLWARPEEAGSTGDRMDPGRRAEPVAADHAQQAVERDAVWGLLGTLPHRQRAALVLRFYEGLNDTEIAEVLDCAVGTVRSHISRALAALRSALDPNLSTVDIPSGRRFP